MADRKDDDAPARGAAREDAPVRTGPTQPQRPEDQAGAATAREANRVADEVERRQGPGGSPAARAETPPGTPPLPTGFAAHAPHNQLSRPGNWKLDVAKKIKEARWGSGPDGAFFETRVRAVAPNEIIPDHASAVPDDYPTHDWLPVNG